MTWSSAGSVPLPHTPLNLPGPFPTLTELWAATYYLLGLVAGWVLLYAQFLGVGEGHLSHQWGAREAPSCLRACWLWNPDQE